jgi:hypothetical protein
MTLNNNVTISIFRKLANQLVSVWMDYIRPMPFETTFHINGVEVEIRIREVKQDTKPLRSDEDDGIAD